MQELDAQNALYREYQKNLRSVNDKAADASKNGFDAFNTDAYRDEVKKIRAALDDALAAQKDFYAKDAEARANWVNGASKALNNYLDEVSNVAKQTEQAWSKGFSGLEDQLVSLVTTGKADFKSLADSIIADLARITIRQQITGPLAKLMLGGIGNGGSALDSLLASNNAFGTGTGESSWLSSLGSSIGNWFTGLKFADGGIPPVGRASIVGERGPELFVPNTAGRIVPNHELSGGGPPVSVVIQNTVGDVATLSMLKEAQLGTERRIAAALGRQSQYGSARI
jgi:lambda family phage tail tape measure protein